MKYRKKSVIIEAVQLRWDTWEEMCEFIGVGKLTDNQPEGKMNSLRLGLDIPTHEGLMHADENDYIIKEPFDKERKFYPCKPDIFKKTYELVEEPEV